MNRRSGNMFKRIRKGNCMEKLIILGTGNANVTRCFNTCFAIQAREDEYFLVDTGGGNGILAQLEKADIPLTQIHEIFLSHEHTDHLLGLIWLIRRIAAKMKQDQYQGDLNIYCHANLKQTILTIAKLTVQDKFFALIGKRIFIHTVADGETRRILDYDVHFFDIRSTKAEQYGFDLTLQNGRRFVFVGDEPYRAHEYELARGADWFLHEAFCLYSQADVFKPYEKHHTTVKEACETAQMLGAKNLILYHTEDRNIQNRKALYSKEGGAYYSGNLFVPDDLDVIAL